MQEFNFKYGHEASTKFLRSDNAVRLSQLFGMTCGLFGRDEGTDQTRGLLAVKTDLGRWESERVELADSSFDDGGANITWQVGDGTLRIESHWTFCDQTGVWSRKDVLTNTSRENITVNCCQARFVFSPGQYEIYSQSALGCCENQGVWQTLHHGMITFACEGGRTCRPTTPFLGLRKADEPVGVAFHILPRGNWVIRVNAHPAGAGGETHLVIELGLADGNLKLDLPPGKTFELPEILFHSLPDGEVHLAADRLHRYALEHYFHSAKNSVPVIYNTWFDDGQSLNVDRLRGHLRTAKELGCEVFVIDAGWYGAEEGSWPSLVGDWRENRKMAFRGRMAEFAEEVRSAGLGFGIWMEPEHVAPSAPILKAHPEWFLPGSRNGFYPDLTNPDAYKYLCSEISRLVETYKLAWMKMDYNFDFHIDPWGTEFSSYYEAWYRLLDEIRTQHPQVFFEGCAGGGGRLELNTLRHFDGHYLSDNTDPIDMLRISEGALLRVPPGRITQWPVLRSVTQSTADSDIPAAICPPKTLTMANLGGKWKRFAYIDVDFVLRVSLRGMFGLSGDISSLPQEVRAKVRRHIDFFKEWREFIIGSPAHLLTAPRLRRDRTGWSAVQLQNPRETSNLVFAYRLAAAEAVKRFRLRRLDRDRKYSVTDFDQPDAPTTLTGGQLMDDGLAVRLDNEFLAAVFVIEPT